MNLLSFNYVSEKTYSNVCSSRNLTLSTCPTFAYNRYNEPSCSVECDIKNREGTHKKNRKFHYQSHHAVFSTLQNANFYLIHSCLFLSNFSHVYSICFKGKKTYAQCLKKFAKASVL